MGPNGQDMSDTRQSETLVWVCIGVCGVATCLAQLSHADRTEPPVGAWTWTFVGPPAPGLTGEDEAMPVEEPPRPGEDPARLFVEAIVQVESAGNPDCVGNAGERGLMQIKSATWREITALLYTEPIDFERAFEPGLNREVGQAYLASLAEFLRVRQSAWQADMRTLLAACYNAGPTRVRDAGFDPGRLPPSTQDYVRRVTALHDLYMASPAERQVPGTAYAFAGSPPRTRIGRGENTPGRPGA
jgi:hypothetical protein